MNKNLVLLLSILSTYSVYSNSHPYPEEHSSRVFSEFIENNQSRDFIDGTKNAFNYQSYKDVSDVNEENHFVVFDKSDLGSLEFNDFVVNTNRSIILKTSDEVDLNSIDSMLSDSTRDSEMFFVYPDDDTGIRKMFFEDKAYENFSIKEKKTFDIYKKDFINVTNFSKLNHLIPPRIPEDSTSPFPLFPPSMPDHELTFISTSKKGIVYQDQILLTRIKESDKSGPIIFFWA